MENKNYCLKVVIDINDLVLSDVMELGERYHAELDTEKNQLILFEAKPDLQFLSITGREYGFYADTEIIK